jgi:hypothetical protein
LISAIFPQYHGRPSALNPHQSRGSVHQRRLCGPGAPREGVGHGRRTADLSRSAHLNGCAVGSEHDVWVEHREKRLEVTAARGSEEGVDDLSLTGEIGVGDRGRSLHPAACAAGELPCRGRRAPHDGSDLVEGNGEQVVKQEGDPLDGSRPDPRSRPHRGNCEGQLAATEIPDEVGDAFAAKTDFDPRQLRSSWLYFRIQPQRLQAWREENELKDRELMRGGRSVV